MLRRDDAVRRDEELRRELERDVLRRDVLREDRRAEKSVTAQPTSRRDISVATGAAWAEAGTAISVRADRAIHFMRSPNGSSAASIECFNTT